MLRNADIYGLEQERLNYSALANAHTEVRSFLH